MHSVSPNIISEEKSDWADILQKRAYGQSTGTVKQ